MQYISIKGRVTVDPELKESSSEKKYIALGVACNQPDTDKEGNESKLTTYYNVYLFDKMAEIFASLKKGDMIFAQGRLKQRSYSSKDGDPKTDNKIFADEFHKVEFVANGEEKETSQEEVTEE